jgi:hypothetical protein
MKNRRNMPEEAKNPLLNPNPRAKVAAWEFLVSGLIST